MVCNALESRGLTCWIANRDIGPGTNYQEEIVKAIRSAKVMVLVFTGNANNSDEIKKELSLASRYKLVVIPARVEDVLPTEAFELELATRQWIDLFDNWERKVDELTTWIESILTNQPQSDHKSTRLRAKSDTAITFILKRPVMLASSVLVFGLIGVVTFLLIIRPASTSLPSLKTDQIVLSCLAPTDSRLQPMYDWLRQRQPLEASKQLLAPLRLFRAFPVTIKQCGEVNSFYNRNGDGGTTVCYELIDWIEHAAPATKSVEGVTHGTAVTATFLQVTLHLISHGLGELLAPSLTKTEDAIDQFGQTILVNFSRDAAKFILTGNGYFIQSSNLDSKRQQAASSWEKFSDTHGSWRQHFYNSACIAYGADMLGFSDLVERGLLPTQRASNCPHEYQQIRAIFAKYVVPNVDMDMLRQVQSMKWLSPVER